MPRRTREETPPDEEEVAYYAQFRNLPHLRYQDEEELGQFDAQQQWYDEHMRQQQQQQQQPHGVAFHIHDAFEHIQENLPEITETLGGLDPELDMTQEYLLDMISRYFMYVLEDHYYKEVEQAEIEYSHNKEKLEDILDRLYLTYIRNKTELPLILSKLNYSLLSSENISHINTWLEFVMNQPESFQANYVETFIGDTYHAYEGEENTISCVKGIIERLLLSIAEACLMHCSMFKNKKRKKSATKRKQDRIKNKARKKQKGGRTSLYRRCDNPVYRKLIRLFKKEIPDINRLSQKWAASVFIDDYEQKPGVDIELYRNRLAAMSAADLEQDFIAFMEKEYKRYGLTQTAQIREKANEYREAQVFERKAFG
jgi:hypothetical protein